MIPCRFGAKNEERESNGASERALVPFLARPKPRSFSAGRLNFASNLAENKRESEFLK